MPTRLALILCALMLSGPAQSQGLFAPAARVNESVVTEYEVAQRQRMLEVFAAPANSRQSAIDRLIEERLQTAEAKRLGLEVTRAQVLDGMDEFAARANLGREEFVARLGQAGVSPETFEDFVRAGIAWREVVRARFGREADVPPDQVDQALSAPAQPSLAYSLSEIILPANTPQAAAQSEALVPRITAITGFDAFASAARAYSASPSRDRGGRIDPLPAENLPPLVRDAVRGLAPGEVSAPFRLPNAIAFFQLRGVEEVPARPSVVALDYAALYIPGGRSPEALAQARSVREQVDSCDDLYGVARGLPPERLQRDTLAPAQVPADVALELAKLDPGEVSLALTRAEGRTLVFLMLCERRYAAQAERPERDALAGILSNRRVSRLAENYLAELRANADVRIE